MYTLALRDQNKRCYKIGYAGPYNREKMLAKRAERGLSVRSSGSMIPANAACKGSVMYSLIFLASCLFLLLSARVSVIDMGYELEQVRAEVMDNDVKLRDLNSKYALLTCPTNLLGDARQMLAMSEHSIANVRRIVVDAT